MSNLFEISQELLELFAAIEDNDGELTPELEEELSIKEDELKDKIKSYSSAVKMLTADILAIKAEKDRLNALQKSKEATIERLKSVLLKAVTMFGAETKAGGRYIDYGTGKVSVRNSKVLEVDEDGINNFVNRYVAGLEWYNMQNQLNREIVKADDLIRYANQYDEDDEFKDLNYSIDDITNVDADIDVQISIRELLESEEGFNLAKALIKYGDFKVKAKVDKTSIKNSIKVGDKAPTFAKLVDNQTVTVK